MNTAVINIKTTPETKTEVQKVARELGVSVSSLVNSFLKDLVRTKRVTLRVDEKLNKQTLAAIKKAQEDRKAGKGSPLFTDDEALIKKDPKKYRHIDTMQQWFDEQGI